MVDNITPFPIPSWERRKNTLGSLKVECVVSQRMLSFDAKATALNLGTVVSVDVLTMPEGNRKPRKLCSLMLTKEDLQRALDSIKVKNTTT